MPVLAKLNSCESQNKKKECVFGKCKYLQELNKTGEYSHLLNLHSSRHCLSLTQRSSIKIHRRPKILNE